MGTNPVECGDFFERSMASGGFQGSTPNEAYFVKCDNETTTQHDISNDKVSILVGVAMLKPAEFIIIKLKIKAGQAT